MEGMIKTNDAFCMAVRVPTIKNLFQVSNQIGF